MLTASTCDRIAQRRLAEIRAEEAKLDGMQAEVDRLRAEGADVDNLQTRLDELGASLARQREGITGIIIANAKMKTWLHRGARVTA